MCPVRTKDAKSQVTTYAYDAYQRVSSVVHGSDATQTTTYYYDQNWNDTTFSQNAWGRIALVTYGGTVCGTGVPAYVEEYSYTTAGLVATKRLTVQQTQGSGCSSVNLIASFTYDNEGKLITTTYPGNFWGGANPRTYAPTTTNSYDAMSRLQGVSDLESDNSFPVPLDGCSNIPTWGNSENGTLNWAANAGYNAAGQLTGLSQLAANAPVNNKGVCTITPTTFSRAWTYNETNQVTHTQAWPMQNVTLPQGWPANNFVSYQYGLAGVAGTNNGQIYEADDSRLGYSIGYRYDALKRIALAATAGASPMSERRHPLHFRPVTSFTLFELPGRGGGVKREGHETAAPPLTPALNGAQVASLRSLIFRPAEPA